MQLFSDIQTFLGQRSAFELFYLFWFFFIFDFFRYVLIDSVVILFYALKRWRERPLRETARRRLFQERPLVSVIAPGKNEGRHIPRLARSLQLQSYNNIEIIIIDDGSDDNTPVILHRLYQEGKIDRYFRNDVRGGKASAANLALRYARGKFIVHLDADSHLRENSIEQLLVPFYMDPDIGAVGGDVRVRNSSASLATCLQSIDYMKAISTGRIVNSTLGILRIISGAYGGFRKDILDRIKGWEVGPGLDGDITVKIRKLGYKVTHEPAAVCMTNVPDSFSKLAKQRMRWDRSLVRFRVRRHRDLLSLTNRNFNIYNFLSIADNLFFNMGLNFKWWIYFLQIVFFHTDFMVIVFFLNYALYFVANIFEFLFALLLYRYEAPISRRTIMLFCYLPLMPLYTNIFLRVVRTYAHLMELFHRASFDDAWNPWKVSRILKNE